MAALDEFDQVTASFFTPAGIIFFEESVGEAAFGPLRRSGQGLHPAGSYEFTVEGHAFADHLHQNGYAYDFVLNLTPVPEPSTFVLLGLGALGAFRLHRNRRR